MTSFHRIICSSEPVRTAFSGDCLLQSWWSLILYLHGKSSVPVGSERDRIQIVASGFRFYAQVYGLLGLVLTGAGIALLWVGQSLYGVLGTVLSGLFLLVVARFGYRASRNFENHEAGSQLSLLLFTVFLMLFLTGFLCTVSQVIHTTGLLPPPGNLFLTVSLLGIGVGSYFIELIFLATPFSFSKTSC